MGGQVPGTQPSRSSYYNSYYSQYAERFALHIKTTEFIPDDTELTSLFIQVQDIIRNRLCPIYITHIQSHMGLPDPLAQGNAEIH